MHDWNFNTVPNMYYLLLKSQYTASFFYCWKLLYKDENHNMWFVDEDVDEYDKDNQL